MPCGTSPEPNLVARSSIRSPAPPRRPSFGWNSLTPTERKVVGLVAEGLTNRQIAERLYRLAAHRRHPPRARVAEARPRQPVELAADARRRAVIDEATPTAPTAPGAAQPTHERKLSPPRLTRPAGGSTASNRIVITTRRSCQPVPRTHRSADRSVVGTLRRPQVQKSVRCIRCVAHPRRRSRCPVQITPGPPDFNHAEPLRRGSFVPSFDQGLWTETRRNHVTTTEPSFRSRSPRPVSSASKALHRRHR